MAIISIPASIGGLTIPGTTSRGPLGALFNSKFRLDSLQYPRDLSSTTKAHVVKFAINEITPIGYEEGKEYKLPSITNATDIFNSVKKLAKGETKINQSLSSKKKRVVSTISLYMPDTVNFQYNAGYSNLSLLDAAAQVAGVAANLPIVSKLGKIASLGISAVQSGAAKLALSTQGLAINPQQQLLFDGIDFRSYQMAFTFTPYSRQEAEDVKKIIELFRTHAAPQIITGGAGMFFVPPSTFDLQFILNGKENRNITRVAESVIESLDVNYAPNGWAAHPDGAPVQTTLTINFKEIELIDRKKIQNGY